MLAAQLLFALLESARNVEFYRLLQMNTDSIVESMFADYVSPLWENYRLLGVTAADSGGQFSLTNREAMLRGISRTNLASADSFLGLSGNSLLTADVSDLVFDEYLLLTDQKGKVFQALAASYMKQNLVYETARAVYSSYEAIEGVCSQYGDGNASIEDALRVLDNTAQEGGADRTSIKNAPQKSSVENVSSKQSQNQDENLITTVVETQKSGILSLVLSERDSVSGAQINLEKTVSHRSLEQGTSSEDVELDWYDGILFNQYLVHYMSCYSVYTNDRGLNYELEYLIGGKNSDKANLTLVVMEILAIREALNLASLAASEQKQLQAWEMAVLLAGATVNPAIVEAVKWGILAAWAYAESVLDLRTLLQGGKVAVYKSSVDWTSDLEAVPSLLSGWSQAKSSEKGITYKDYLGLLLFFHSGDKLAMRAMDVQEAAVRKTKGYEKFRMDTAVCGTRIQVIYEYVLIFWDFVSLFKSGQERVRIYREAEYSYLL